LAQHISQGMQLSSPWLREAMKRLLERGAITADYLLEFLGASPLFPDKRKAILKAGLEAYVKGDAVACMHILIPQVEQALRQLASLIGAPIFAPRHGGGFRVKTMDTLLQERALGNTLGEDVVTYFRVLFTDARGWNLRNDVSHGLLSEGVLTMSVADRVVHALLVLGLVQEDEAVPKKDAP